MAYLLDSNVFIAAKNLYYGTDFCPAFWEWIKLANSLGAVCSVIRVKDGIVAGDDELSAWPRPCQTVFLSTRSSPIYRHYNR